MSGATAKLIGTAAILGAVSGISGRADTGSDAVPGHPDDRTIVHVLNRIGFGPRSGDIERVRAAGLATFIDRQLHPEQLGDPGLQSRLAGFDTLGKTSRELAQQYFIPAEAARRQQQTRNAGGEPDTTPTEAMTALRGERRVLLELAEQKILRAAYSERQLEEVLVDFWFNHFNVFAGKGPVRVYLTEYERDTIRPHVLGKFRDLLGATAHSPAMLFYLDNWQSAGASERVMRRPERGRPFIRSAQRRSRGINENYAREVMELHTLGADGGYTQHDVQEVARAFTGWTIAAPRQGGGFRFDPAMHDAGDKTVLGRRIKAGGGEHDGEEVLDILASHPSTARFIATKLARRFISDDPPQQVVDRAAATFRRTGGDIREVVRTIVTSPEFFAARRTKVKSPFEFVISAVRASGVDVTDALPLVQALRDLGTPLYGCQPPTGYADRASAWVNTGALLGRMNFAVLLTGGRPRAFVATAATHADDLQAARSSLIREVFAGDLSDATARTIDNAETAPQALALLLGSPEFQKR
jgi:uncharacterized protein (DUF1800 family)